MSARNKHANRNHHRPEAAPVKRTNPAPKKISGLRGSPTTFSGADVEVDRDAGVIKNVALMSVGPARGHGFEIDQTTIEQLVALSAQQSDGVKCRFKHPEIEESRDTDGNVIQSVADDTGTMVGRIKGARIVGDQARGDVYLGNYATMIPGLGNVRDYLLGVADEDPSSIGMSAFFTFNVDPQMDDYGNITGLPARLESLDAIDFVGVPAANPRGLLSAKAGAFDPQPPSGWSDESPKPEAQAPLPTSTPEFPQDARGAYLRALVESKSPLHYGSVAARAGGRLEAVRAGCEWLASNGYAARTGNGVYRATPAGTTQAASVWTKK